MREIWLLKVVTVVKPSRPNLSYRQKRSLLADIRAVGRLLIKPSLGGSRIKQLSKKIGKHSWHDHDAGEEVRVEQEMTRAALKKRALELGLEVDHLSFKG